VKPQYLLTMLLMGAWVEGLYPANDVCGSRQGSCGASWDPPHAEDRWRAAHSIGVLHDLVGGDH